MRPSSPMQLLNPSGGDSLVVFSASSLKSTMLWTLLHRIRHSCMGLTHSRTLLSPLASPQPYLFCALSGVCLSGSSLARLAGQVEEMSERTPSSLLWHCFGTSSPSGIVLSPSTMPLPVQVAGRAEKKTLHAPAQPRQCPRWHCPGGSCASTSAGPASELSRRAHEGERVVMEYLQTPGEVGQHPFTHCWTASSVSSFPGIASPSSPDKGSTRRGDKGSAHAPGVARQHSPWDSWGAPWGSGSIRVGRSL